MSYYFNNNGFGLFRLVRVPVSTASLFLQRMLEAWEGGFGGFGNCVEGGGDCDDNVWPLKQQQQQQQQEEQDVSPTVQCCWQPQYNIY